MPRSSITLSLKSAQLVPKGKGGGHGGLEDRVEDGESRLDVGGDGAVLVATARGAA